MPIVGAESNTMPYDNNGGIGGVLNAVLSGVSNKFKDTAYRKSAAKILGVPEEELGYFQREELKDLVKEKMKSSYGEYKPRTKEEALEYEQAKAGFKGDNFTKKAKESEAEISLKLKNGEKLTKAERDWYVNQDTKRYVPDNMVIQDSAAPAKPGYDPKAVKSWDDVPLMGRIMSAITPSSTPEEKALGGLRAGGVFNPPEVTPANPVAAQPSAPAPDPVAKRIQEAISSGMDPKEVARQLKEKGIDPATYGL